MLQVHGAAAPRWKFDGPKPLLVQTLQTFIGSLSIYHLLYILYNIYLYNTVYIIYESEWWDTSKCQGTAKIITKLEFPVQVRWGRVSDDDAAGRNCWWYCANRCINPKPPPKSVDRCVHWFLGHGAFHSCQQHHCVTSIEKSSGWDLCQQSDGRLRWPNH